MDPILYAMPKLFAVLIAVATFLHWDRRARGVPVRHFGTCSAEWRELALRRAVAILSAQ